MRAPMPVSPLRRARLRLDLPLGNIAAAAPVALDHLPVDVPSLQPRLSNSPGHLVLRDSLVDLPLPTEGICLIPVSP